MNYLAIISDTHGYHRRVNVPTADIVIHCGDFCAAGLKENAMDFLDWFSRLPHQYKILISGNHDTIMEYNPASVPIPDGVHYLNDSGCEIAGLKFWGSPVQPAFLNWSFNRERGADIRRHWDKIQEGIDVLITHGPPARVLDMTGKIQNLKTGEIEIIGCEDLYKAVRRVKPKLHCFGHIHSGYGTMSIDGIRFVNAAICTEQYQPTNKAWVVPL